MDLFKKIKVRLKPIRTQQSPGTQIKIEVKEKEAYACSHCGNKYESHHYYCPQCLGMIKSSPVKRGLLKIISIRKGKEEQLEYLLTDLSGKKDFPYKKAFQNLAWVAMSNSDPAVLLHWKEVLDAEKVEAQLEPMPSKEPVRGRKKCEPMFPEKAPLPYFYSAATDFAVREVARNMKNISVRLQWIELILTAIRIVEGFYKRNPSNRVLFSDHIYKIDQELMERSKDYHSYYKVREEEFLKVIEKLKAEFDEMETEIDEVRKQVEQQL